MTAIELLKQLGEMGCRYHARELPHAITYFEKMIADNRVVTVATDGNLKAVLVFSLDYDIDKFLKKETWDYLPHNPFGSILYVEKLISTGWSKEIRREFEQAVVRYYPTIEYGVWHRWAKWGDRKVVTKRRFHYV